MNNVEQAGELASAEPGLANQIDQICDDFERALTQGEWPRIEDFLSGRTGLSRERLLIELLLVDREFRIRRGESATRDDYRQRFPAYSSMIDSLEFATIDDRKSTRAARAAVPNQVGSKLAHFELIEELGTGASGSVWKARDTRLRRLVAVKIPRQGTLTKNEQERFVGEGQACAQLRHPNIVAVHEVLNENGYTFIVSEFIDGLDLRDWLCDHRLTAHEAAELTAGLAEALHHAHEQGIIHRDLKPANVLIDRDGQPHVTDFGLAKWNGNAPGMTVEGNVLGTPAYMSPEQARGDAFQVDRRADVYALGALLYEMLTVQPPFDGDVVAMIHKVLHEDPPPPRKINLAVPRDLETICLKAMAKEPNRRYPSAQEMAVDLRRFVRGDSILAHRVGPLEKTWRWVRRHQTLTAAAVLLGIVVAAASAMMHSLSEKNYRLQGYRPVHVITRPPGARVAIVPIDERTGEPNPDLAGIIRPRSATPLTVKLRPGRYLFEAALFSDGEPVDFAEQFEDVAPSSARSEKQTQVNQSVYGVGDVLDIAISIRGAAESVAGMVAVPVSEQIRRKNNLLPPILYIDAKETAPTDAQAAESTFTFRNRDGNVSIPFEIAEKMVKRRGLRLASASEYDAIIEAATKQQLRYAGSGRPAVIDEIFGGLAEWTTTKYRVPGIRRTLAASTALQNTHVLKGYGDLINPIGLQRTIDGYLIAAPDAVSPLIGYRGVRSGSPRFVTP